jgi:outer membrane protein OmpA-like peptidoglycan-associated protein
MRTIKWLGMAVAASLLVANVGCTGDVQLKAEVKTPEPPKPPPPPPDADGDGVVDDGTDKCVAEKEEPRQLQRTAASRTIGSGRHRGQHGQVPTDPETKSNYQTRTGVWRAEGPPREQRVRITDKILFAFGKADIDKQSDDLIKNIAQVIKDNPQVEFVEVAGHADKVGNDAGNVQLTKKRAEAVVVALAALGVDKNRLRGAGYGRYCPIDAGDTEEAREKNRRVEFKVMKMGGKETGIALGCEEAAKKGIKPAGVPATAPSGADRREACGREARREGCAPARGRSLPRRRRSSATGVVGRECPPSPPR